MTDDVGTGPPEPEDQQIPLGDLHGPAESQVSPELRATRALLASVEELRALLAPLSDPDRERVLELARRLNRPGAHGPE